MEIREILESAIQAGASDIFLIAGLPVTFKSGGSQQRVSEGFLMPDALTSLVNEIYEISGRERSNLDGHIDDDFSFALSRLACAHSTEGKSRLGRLIFSDATASGSCCAKDTPLPACSITEAATISPSL